MGSNMSGGMKTRDKLLARDPDYYKKLGAAGGRKSKNTGFALSPERARLAGQKGGTNRWRKWKENHVPEELIPGIPESTGGD